MTSFKRKPTYVDEKKVRGLFEKYDLDKNGTLEKKEFKRIMGDILRDLDEIITEPKLTEISEEGFKLFDTDRSKKIEFSEFYDFIRFVISEKGFQL